jgi:hypothetical protein
MERSIRSLKHGALGRRVFVSHAREDAKLAERIALAIRGRDCTVFLDANDLPPGGNYEARIHQAIKSSSVFVFLISPASVSDGRYPLTELKFAEQRWTHPANHVLPVFATEMPIDHVPEYLRAASIMKARGDLAAEVAAAVDEMLPKTARFAGTLATTIAVAIAGASLLYSNVGTHKPPPRTQETDRSATIGSGDAGAPVPMPGGPESASMIEVPPMIELKFTLDPPTANDPNLSKDQIYFLLRSPSSNGRRKISRQDDGFYVPDKVAMPRENPVLHAFFVRSSVNSQLVSAELPQTVICLRRSTSRPKIKSPGEAILRCKEGDRPCDKFDQTDPGWFEVSNDCPNQSKPRSPAGLRRKTRFASLFAIDATAAPASPTWIVPSLETLIEQKDRNQSRDGFTTFTIAAAAGTKIDADAVSLDLRVNDTPILIEGLPADLQPHPLQAGESLKLTFGLQNLNFDGRYSGCDRIEAKLLFYKNGEVVGEPVVLPLYYAALRDAAPAEIATGQGKFTWSATYTVVREHDAKGPAQSDWRVFLTSLPRKDLNRLQKMREDIARLGLVFTRDGENYPIVAVVRPPLQGDAFGLALGMVQPTGQIRFTFGKNEANGLLAFALEARLKNPAARNLIAASAYPYEEPPNINRRYACTASH